MPNSLGKGQKPGEKQQLWREQKGLATPAVDETCAPQIPVHLGNLYVQWLWLCFPSTPSALPPVTTRSRGSPPAAAPLFPEIFPSSSLSGWFVQETVLVMQQKAMRKNTH